MRLSFWKMLYELSKYNMIRYEDHWCFECFEPEKHDVASAETHVSFEYKISIL